MIRLSAESDREGLIFLWKEAFGDSEEAIGLFLDNRYIPENTVVSENDGKITSMLFLLDGKLSVKGKLFNSYYLYAAATLKEFRGRGIMKEMLDFSKHLSYEREKDFICLKPAEKGLYDYYASNGYRTVFSSETVVISADKTDDISVIPPVDYDRFVWDDKSVDYAIKQHEYYGGKTLLSREGHCLYTVEDGICTVKDIIFTDCDLRNMLHKIRISDDPTCFEIDLPFGYEINSAEYSVKDSGMALAVSDRAENIISQINNAYLNLTLD